MLIDTGATRTIIRPTTISSNKKLQPTRWPLRTATGEAARVYGETIATFQIGNTIFDHQTLVANIEEDVILGMDILGGLGCSLNLKKGAIKIGNEDVILQSRKELAANVILAEDTEVKGHSEMMVCARLDSNCANDQETDPEPRVRGCTTSVEVAAFEDFWVKIQEGRKIRHDVVKEVQQDLFAVPPSYALACCITEDLDMTRGVAGVFRRKFGRVTAPVQPGPVIGRALRLPNEGRRAFCLVTGVAATGKAGYEDLWDSLMHLREHLTRAGVSKLAVPKMGGGPAGRDWRVIRGMMEAIFKDAGIEILVCCKQLEGRRPDDRTVDCFFFKRSQCSRGASCRYRHTLAQDCSGTERV
jgi:predicted aspartyl protease